MGIPTFWATAAATAAAVLALLAAAFSFLTWRNTTRLCRIVDADRLRRLAASREESWQTRAH